MWSRFWSTDLPATLSYFDLLQAEQAGAQAPQELHSHLVKCCLSWADMCCPDSSSSSSSSSTSVRCHTALTRGPDGKLHMKVKLGMQNVLRQLASTAHCGDLASSHTRRVLDAVMAAADSSAAMRLARPDKLRSEAELAAIWRAANLLFAAAMARRSVHEEVGGTLAPLQQDASEHPGKVHTAAAAALTQLGNILGGTEGSSSSVADWRIQQTDDAVAQLTAAAVAAAASPPARTAGAAAFKPFGAAVADAKLRSWVCVACFSGEEAAAGELAAIRRLQLHTTRNSDGCTALHYAAAAHKPKLVQQLLGMGADVNAQMQHGLTALHLACLGRVGDAAAMAELVKAAETLPTLMEYAAAAGPACSSIVQMFLQHGAVADTDITPLHLLACWSPELGGAVKAEDQHSSNEDEGVGNGTNKKTNSSMTAAAHPGNRGASSSSSSSSTQAQDAALLAARRAGVQEQLAAARLLIAGHRMPDGSISGRIDVDAATEVDGATALTTAAITGAFEIAELLLQHGADLNLPRTLDAARPIDIAVCLGQLEIARLLLEHGAEVKQGPLLVKNTSAGAGSAKLPEQHPEMILLTTLRTEHPLKARVVQLLLQRGAPLEEVWEPTGETALSMAVAAGDVEVVRLLVAAGADLDACRAKEPLWPPLAVAAFEGKLEILQILLDAGADHSCYISEVTGYDMVQAAANAGQFEAVIKLVEAGASWRLSSARARAIGDTPYYVPDLLRLKCKAGSTLKVSFIEYRLKLAEKVSKQRKDKAAAAAAAVSQADSTQQQLAADVVDLDALAAEIEALGVGSKSALPAADGSSSKKGKKLEKLKKQRAKQQQKQLQVNAVQSSANTADADGERTASGAVAADDLLSELMDDVELKAQQLTAHSCGCVSQQEQHIWLQQQKQQQRPTSVPTSSGQIPAVLPAAVEATAGSPSRQQAAGPASSSAAGSSRRTRRKCIVCMERLRDVLLLPCKHLVLCSECVEQLEGRGALGCCPYCRQPCVERVCIHQ
ncbi:hypothetical protein COO60DRAFT_725551 [Scenedesmus sp. NREL 46B-D3]|nr:hypothetical protein COO60DRAFT_725551 [Scenedesmus sp. NREL 46B-D3]